MDVRDLFPGPVSGAYIRNLYFVLYFVLFYAHFNILCYILWYILCYILCYEFTPPSVGGIEWLRPQLFEEGESRGLSESEQ